MAAMPTARSRPGNAEEHVHHAVDGIVPRAAGVPGREPERPADDHGRADRHHRDIERDARSVDDPAQDVAAEAVGAEPRLRPRPGLDEVEDPDRCRYDHRFGQNESKCFNNYSFAAEKYSNYPWEVTYGPDNKLWVTEAHGYKAYRIEP